MSEARFHFLSQEDVVAAGGLDVAATIDVVEEALRLHAGRHAAPLQVGASRARTRSSCPIW